MWTGGVVIEGFDSSDIRKTNTHNHGVRKRRKKIPNLLNLSRARLRSREDGRVRKKGCGTK